MKAVALVGLALGVFACGKVVGSGDDNTDPCAKGGVCECTAATEDTDCGAHQFCDESSTGRTCACVAGYTDGGSGCVWTGALKDPQISSSSVWTTTSGALLNPTAPGGVDAGEADFVASAICSLGGIKQTFDMPTLAKAEPLVLELSYKDAIVTGRGIQDSALMGMSLGGSWAPLPSFLDATFHTVRVCLGDAAYAPSGMHGKGGSIDLELGPYMKALQCPNTLVNNFAIDHAQIVAANAGECGTMPGQGPNFNAEGSTGWTFTTGGSSSAGFAAGIGANGSRGARITQGMRCDVSPSMTHDINVPDTANPALDLFVGSSGASPLASASLVFGTLPIPLPAAGTSGTVHACLPTSLRGLSTTLQFRVSDSAGGLCADIVNDQVVADNVQVVDDPACASSSAGPNPSFEQTGTVLGGAGGGLVNGGAIGSAVLIRTGAGHTGTHFLNLESYARCSSASITFLPIVPAPSGSDGPAFTFYSNIPVTPDTSTTARAQGGTSITLTKGGGWVKNTICLDPVYAGRSLPVIVSQYGGAGTCDGANGYGTQATSIDDIAVGTSPGCPAQ